MYAQTSFVDQSVHNFDKSVPSTPPDNSQWTTPISSPPRNENPSLNHNNGLRMPEAELNLESKSPTSHQKYNIKYVRTLYNDSVSDESGLCMDLIANDTAEQINNDINMTIHNGYTVGTTDTNSIQNYPQHVSTPSPAPSIDVSNIYYTSLDTDSQKNVYLSNYTHSQSSQEQTSGTSYGINPYWIQGDQEQHIMPHMSNVDLTSPSPYNTSVSSPYLQANSESSPSHVGHNGHSYYSKSIPGDNYPISPVRHVQNNTTLSLQPSNVEKNDVRMLSPSPPPQNVSSLEINHDNERNIIDSNTTSMDSNNSLSQKTSRNRMKKSAPQQSFMEILTDPNQQVLLTPTGRVSKAKTHRYRKQVMQANAARMASQAQANMNTDISHLSVSSLANIPSSSVSSISSTTSVNSSYETFVNVPYSDMSYSGNYIHPTSTDSYAVMGNTSSNMIPKFPTYSTTPRDTNSDLTSQANNTLCPQYDSESHSFTKSVTPDEKKSQLCLQTALNADENNSSINYVIEEAIMTKPEIKGPFPSGNSQISTYISEKYVLSNSELSYPPNTTVGENTSTLTTALGYSPQHYYPYIPTRGLGRQDRSTVTMQCSSIMARLDANPTVRFLWAPEEGTFTPLRGRCRTMCFSLIQKNIKRYRTMHQFAQDLRRVIDNVLMYHPFGHPVRERVICIWDMIVNMFSELHGPYRVDLTGYQAHTVLPLVFFRSILVEELKYNSTTISKKVCRRLARRGGTPRPTWPPNWYKNLTQPLTVEKMLLTNINHPPCCPSCCQYSATTFEQARKQMAMSVYNYSSNYIPNIEPTFCIHRMVRIDPAKLSSNRKKSQAKLLALNNLLNTQSSNSCNNLSNSNSNSNISLLNQTCYAPTTTLPRKSPVCDNCGAECAALKPLKHKRPRRLMSNDTNTKVIDENPTLINSKTSTDVDLSSKSTASIPILAELKMNSELSGNSTNVLSSKLTEDVHLQTPKAINSSSNSNKRRKTVHTTCTPLESAPLASQSLRSTRSRPTLY